MSSLRFYVLQVSRRFLRKDHNSINLSCVNYFLLYFSSTSCDCRQTKSKLRSLADSCIGLSPNFIADSSSNLLNTLLTKPSSPLKPIKKSKHYCSNSNSNHQTTHASQPKDTKFPTNFSSARRNSFVSLSIQHYINAASFSKSL